MTPNQDDSYVLGIDYGTDSVRAVLVRVGDGFEMGQGIFEYPRWKQGLYCEPHKYQFRQHPLDYLEGLESSIQMALQGQDEHVRAGVIGIGVDTTGSTPVAVDAAGVPLALLQDFVDNPNAMFVLWKDHTAILEAQEINGLCHEAGAVDYTRYCGGIYSSEWFWAKITHVVRADDAVAQAAYSWVEHCDWIPFVLTGGKEVQKLLRSRCAAGHKALWHPSWDGLPPDSFFAKLEPKLAGLRSRLYHETYTSDQPAGTLSPAWAQKLGLSENVTVAVGAFDAHMGAVGGQIEPYFLSKVMGTSTCDMLVAPGTAEKEKLVAGICGQVNGSIIPGMLGMEAGQSAFGDVYAWFSEVLLWPLKQMVDLKQLDERIFRQMKADLIPMLSQAAEGIPAEESTVLALDWLNGRRTPDAEQTLKGAIMGLNLGTNAPLIFRALIEATCFGAKAIVDRFRREKVPVEGLIGLGGVAKKSPFIMQTMADVMNMPIKIASSDQTCALGAAMFAATAAGAVPHVEEAMQQMGTGFEGTYHPNPQQVAYYASKYRAYQAFGAAIERLTKSS